MLYVYEFKIEKTEGALLALPYDFDGGTQGKDERELAELAADWLRVEIEQRLIQEEPIPKATFGHGDARSLIVAVEVSLDTINAVPAYEAAELLGVSRGRVSQMVSAGLLSGFRKGRDAFVTKDSIQARKANTPKAGRPPRKELASA